MRELLELVYLGFVRPRSVFRRIREGVPWWWAAAVFGGVQIFGQTLGAMSLDGLQSCLGGVLAEMPEGLLRYGWGLYFPLALAYWWVKTAVWHLMAEFLGGEGRGTNLFFSLGFAGLPLTVGYAGAGLVRLVGDAYWLLAPGFWLLAGLWTLGLEVMAVQETYGLSGGRALLVVALPVVVLGGLGLVALVSLGLAWQGG
ncbi:MAG: Yip1 family protein [Moorellales bacterium]